MPGATVKWQNVHLFSIDESGRICYNEGTKGNLALVNLPNVTTKSQVQNFRLDFTIKEGVKGTINWQDESKMTLTFPGGGDLVCYL